MPNCSDCDKFPAIIDESDVEQAMNSWSLASIRNAISAAEGQVPLAVSIIREGSERLCKVLRTWTDDEYGFMWPLRMKLLSEDPNKLPAFVSNAVFLDREAKLEDSLEEEVSRLLQAAQTASQENKAAPLHRDAFVILQMLSRHCRQKSVGEGILAEVIELIKQSPDAELKVFLDPLVLTSKHLLNPDVESSCHDSCVRFANRILDFLCERCADDSFLAQALYFSLQTHSLPEEYKLRFFQALRDETIEVHLRRFEAYSVYLLKPESAALCTASAWGEKKPFPLPTHDVFSVGTKDDARKQALGKSKAKKLNFQQVNDTSASLGVLLKNDDSVMAERRAANAMQLMENLILESPDMQNLLTSEGLKADDVRVSYSIFCLTCQDAMIELIPDAVTLRQAQTHNKDRRAPDGQRPLHRFFDEAKHAAWQKVLAVTCAMSAVLSYLLHLGDRHPDNVMVTTLGRYAHIDFGWQLGYTPTVQKTLGVHPEMRLDYDEIWNAIDKKTMDNLFYPVLGLCFRELRRHSHLMREMIEDMTTIYVGRMTLGNDHGSAATYVGQRLVPGVLTDREAQVFIENLILNNRNQKSFRIFEEFQKQFHEANQTLSTKSMSLLAPLIRPCEMCETSNPLGLLYNSQCPHCKLTFCEQHLSKKAHRCKSCV